MMTMPERPQTGNRAVVFRRLLPSLIVGILVPLLTYTLLSPHMTEATALALSGAIPVLWTVGGFVWRRRIDPVGVFSVAGFGLGLLMLWLTGGSPLAVKLPEAVLTGLLGLAFVVSAALRRPLVLIFQRTTARNDPALAGGLADPVRRQRAIVVSALLGATLLVHAVVVTGLALTLPTVTFLAVSRPIGIGVLAVGVAVVLLYVRRVRQRA